MNCGHRLRPFSQRCRSWRLSPGIHRRSEIAFGDGAGRNVELEARLIDDLLDLMRIARGKLELSLQPVSVHDCMKNAIAIVESELRSKNLQLDVAPLADRHIVQGDNAPTTGFLEPAEECRQIY